MKIFDNKSRYKNFLAVFLLLIFLTLISFPSWGQRVLFAFLGPLNISSRSFLINFSDKSKTKSDLLSEILILEKKNSETSVDSARLLFLEDENSKLREYLDFTNSNSFNYTLTNVVWQENFLNFFNFNQNIVIDKGGRDGLKSGLLVVNEHGVVIGKIIEVEDSVSRVCLVNNNFCKIAAVLSNEAKSVGLTEGDMGLSIKVNFIPQDESVSVGDVVMTSGLEKDIPRGLTIGRVNFVSRDASDIWLDVVAEPLFRANNLNILLVVLP